MGICFSLSEVCTVVLVVSSSPDETSDALVASSNTAHGHDRHDRSADRRTTEYAPGFNYDVRLWYIGRTPWADSEHRHQMSPLTHVASVKTPTLLMHGINDRTDTEPQSMMFFTGIRDQGKTARYTSFPASRTGSASRGTRRLLTHGE